VNRAIIIVAGGAGLRMGAEIPKQFLPLAGVPLLVRTVKAFVDFDASMKVVLVLPASFIELWSQMAAKHLPFVHCEVVPGGAERYFSVKNGLMALEGFDGIIGIHDGVRPLVSARLIDRCYAEASRSGAVIPVIPVVDSLREVTAEGSQHVDRSRFRAVQTPQCFQANLLRNAYEKPFSADFTDDASVVEADGRRVELIAGEHSNIKITTPEDLIWASTFFAS